MKRLGLPLCDLDVPKLMVENNPKKGFHLYDIYRVDKPDRNLYPTQTAGEAFSVKAPDDTDKISDETTDKT